VQVTKLIFVRFYATPCYLIFSRIKVIYFKQLMKILHIKSGIREHSLGITVLIEVIMYQRQHLLPKRKVYPDDVFKISG
jgi:hypothetical protein